MTCLKKIQTHSRQKSFTIIQAFILKQTFILKIQKLTKWVPYSLYLATWIASSEDLSIRATMSQYIVPSTQPWQFVQVTSSISITAASVRTTMILHWPPATFISIGTAAHFVVIWGFAVSSLDFITSWVEAPFTHQEQARVLVLGTASVPGG